MLPREVEILDRLNTINMEMVVLLAELREIREGAVRTKKPIELRFGKNIITWDGGALAIKGKGYKIVKALYEADKMRLKEATLDKRFWDGKVTHKTFKENIRQIAEKLERGKFPYSLLPVESKPKVVPIGEKGAYGKKSMRYIPAEIIGVKLHAKNFLGILAGNR